MRRGCFISFEGVDGSGKSTQIDLLKDYLKDNGYDVVLTREPGGTHIGDKIRNILLDPKNAEMSHMTEALLYAASRAQHVEQVIMPALEAGSIVICDRFTDSSIAYQGYGRQLGDCVASINEYAAEGCVPDITFLMKIRPEVGTVRISGREKDRMEREDEEFRQRVYDGYEELEKRAQGRIVGIDASKEKDEISRDIIKNIEQLLSDERFQKR